MKDSFGRQIEYMRISLTDWCNLNCRYCVPKPDRGCSSLLPKSSVLKIVSAAVSLGITSFRLTGGEPLGYPEIAALIREMKGIPGVQRVALTTNGVLLGQLAEELRRAGLDGVNVSLDTLDEECFAALTGCGRLPEVLEGIERAKSVGLKVKLNVVLKRDTDVLALSRFAGERELPLRFIERMPIGRELFHDKTEEETDREDPSWQQALAILADRYGTPTSCGEDGESHAAVPGSGPAVYYQFPGLKTPIGFISAVHGKFCSTCNRIRITSAGYLRPCLAAGTMIDLTRGLEEGEAALTALLREGIIGKPAGHHFEEKQGIEADSLRSVGG